MSRRVALVHEWLTVPAGSEEVFAEMLDLYPGVVFGSIIDQERCAFLKGVECRPSFLQYFPLAMKRHFLWAPLMPWAYARMDLTGFDLVLTSSHSFAHGVRKAPGALHVTYYHTPARSLWVPEIDDRASKTPIHRFIASILKKKDLEASKGPDYLLANSETTAARLRKFYGRDVYRVIYPPVHTKRFNAVQKTSDDEGFLYWGRLIPYKKVDVLIEAARITGLKLNIVGSGPMEAQLRTQAEALTNVVFHGRLPNEDLYGLMARSKAVLFAAYEDFGIVPVEAMAAGLPVAAYSQGGASETVTAECGVQFDAQTGEAVAEAMRALQDRVFDPETLKAHAAQYDVAVFRERYRQTIEELWALRSQA